jgi:hypothetical protein
VSYLVRTAVRGESFAIGLELTKWAFIIRENPKSETEKNVRANLHVQMSFRYPKLIILLMPKNGLGCFANEMWSFKWLHFIVEDN